jgi:hypothetical protein
MTPKASFGNISQHAAGFCTIRFASGIVRLTLQCGVVSEYGVTNPTSLCFGDNSTNASNFTLFVISESH